MDNRLFLKELKLKGVCKIDKLPSGYDYILDEVSETLTLKLDSMGVCANMQTDAGAFESWAMILKQYCAKFIKTIVIDWVEPKNKNEHFNRFVYRLTRFVQNYDWVTTNKQIPQMPLRLVCNAPTRNASGKNRYKVDSEGMLESVFVERKREKKEYDIIDRQLPMGLFEGIVSNDTIYTPGKRSNVDIWAVKDSEMYIFELKKQKNCPLGIISELMFYTNVINDLIAKKIVFSDDAKKIKFRSFDKFYDIYDGVRNVSKIHAVFLAEFFHPLFDEDVLKLINNSTRFKGFNIEFKKANP